MYNNNAVARQIQNDIERELSKLGLLCRVFSRQKSEQSLMKKINKEKGKYSLTGKKIQDMVGVRVVLYFLDDIEIACKKLDKVFKKNSESIDEASTDNFGPTRCNYIYYLPEKVLPDCQFLKTGMPIDNTFEVQFRTTLSEGWHEVEHDLRYKCKEDWNSYDDYSRALNGIYATLETSDWSMLQIFESLAYNHYKKKHIEALLRSKLRLRLQDTLTEDLKSIIHNKNLYKEIYRLDRKKILSKLLVHNFSIPITMDNIIYVMNFFFFEDPDISEAMPVALKGDFESLVSRVA